jgi:hypothetical protein
MYSREKVGQKIRPLVPKNGVDDDKNWFSSPFMAMGLKEIILYCMNRILGSLTIGRPGEKDIDNKTYYFIMVPNYA